MDITKQMIGALLVIGMIGAYGCKEEDELKVDINPTQENLCVEVAEVVCHNSFQCCVGEDLEDMFGIELTTNEKDCRRDVELMCEQEFSPAFYSYENGRISFDLALISTCLENMIAPEEGCFPYDAIDWEAAAQCASIGSALVGLVQTNGDCLFSFDCAGEAYCDVDRKCKNLPGLGEPCDGSLPCRDGFYCGYNVTTLESTCMLDIPLNGLCNTYNSCANGLYCRINPDLENTDTAVSIYEFMNGVCTAPGAVGALCEGDNECSTYNCLPGTCAQGDECYSDADCTGTCSISGYTCNNDTLTCPGTCVGGDYDGYSCSDDDSCYGYCSNTSALCSAITPCASVCVNSAGTATTYSCITVSDCDAIYGTGLGYTCENVQTCSGAGACTQETCQGASTCSGRVCAENYAVTDYCDLAWQWF